MYRSPAIALIAVTAVPGLPAAPAAAGHRCATPRR